MQEYPWWKSFIFPPLMSSQNAFSDSDTNSDSDEESEIRALIRQATERIRKERRKCSCSTDDEPDFPKSDMNSSERRRKNRNHNTLASAVVLSGASIAFAVWLSVLLNFQLFNRSAGVYHSVDVVSPPPSINTSLPASPHRQHQSVAEDLTDPSNRCSVPPPLQTGYHGLDQRSRDECRRTCKLQIVESIPENLTFSSYPLDPPTISTYEAWKRLIQLAENEIVLAAYKSSLRGKHVLDEPSPSARPGEKIYDQLKRAALEGGVHIYAVENDPPKDPGDNADALALARAGVLERRSLHMDRILDHAGVMHSKFFIVDNRHFYLGSANFDWRSLNQKMELGLLITDCPCLATDLRILFDTYWKLADDEEKDCNGTCLNHGRNGAHQSAPTSPIALTNATHPLTISYGDTDLDLYLAASPRDLNDGYRNWDLEAIVDVIDHARTFLYINVMDYIPMIVYQKPRRFWPVIDDAIRRAVVERGVNVRILTAALHFTPESFGFLESLQIIGQGLSRGSINVRILTVPIITPFHHLIARDRRTHRKFVVTDDSVVVGTSNWSGDYFTATTGAAIIIRQRPPAKNASSIRDNKPDHPDHNRTFIDQMRRIFLRDYESSYARDLHDYVRTCLDPVQRRDTCQPEKKSKPSSTKVN